MIEVVGDLWEFPADVRVITTNGTVRKNGEAVMGRGCALEAKQRWPTMPRALGRMIEQHGNHVHRLLRRVVVIGEKENHLDGFELYSFPVKHHWMQKADISLIRRSAEELLCAVETGPLTVVLPHPGCGNGGLHWCSCAAYPEEEGEREPCGGVYHVLAPILDDRFHVISF